jgi:co-chaperonin GroES (HSP10)
MILDFLRPTNDLLVIRRIVEEQPRTASGILLPPVEESADTPYRGVVVAAGPGKHSKLSGAAWEVVAALTNLVDKYHAMPIITEGPRGIALQHWQRAVDALSEHRATQRNQMQVKVGDVVVFSKNLYQEFKIDGETLIVMGEASIMGILEPEATDA